MGWADLLDKVFGFLKENVPWLFLGYEIGKSEENKLKAENIELGLKAKDLGDEKNIKDHNASLSDDDLKSEILGSIAKPDDGDKK